MRHIARDVYEFVLQAVLAGLTLLLAFIGLPLFLLMLVLYVVLTALTAVVSVIIAEIERLGERGKRGRTYLAGVQK